LISRLNIGGPAHHVLLLTKHLPAHRYETYLVAGQEPTGELRAEKWAAHHGVNVHYLPALRRTPSLWHDLLALWQLYRLLRTYKPHILHTHTAKAGTLGRLAGWLAGVPVRVHTFHGHSLSGYFPAPISRLYQGVERLLARLSTRLITISPTLKDELVKKFRIAPPEKFVVIRLGFDMERWATYDLQKARAWRQAWAPHGETLLAWIGRMVPIKQVERLLEAAAPLIRRGMPLRLVLVGEGPERARLQALTQQLGIAGACLWPGPIDDMPTLYRAIDAVALPSRNEGTPSYSLRPWPAVSLSSLQLWAASPMCWKAAPGVTSSRQAQTGISPSKTSFLTSPTGKLRPKSLKRTSSPLMTTVASSRRLPPSTRAYLPKIIYPPPRNKPKPHPHLT
jgi:glycosyltransferase involved in cell wall biosynthesis